MVRSPSCSENLLIAPLLPLWPLLSRRARTTRTLKSRASLNPDQMTMKTTAVRRAEHHWLLPVRWNNVVCSVAGRGWIRSTKNPKRINRGPSLLASRADVNYPPCPSRTAVNSPPRVSMVCLRTRWKRKLLVRNHPCNPGRHRLPGHSPPRRHPVPTNSLQVEVAGRSSVPPHRRLGPQWVLLLPSRPAEPR